MKTLIISLALGLSLAMTPAFSADAPAKKNAPAKKKMTFTGKPSMTVAGRFHKLHEKQELLECADCHDKVQEDILFLRKDDRMSQKLSDEGQVDRDGCLTCHKPGYKPNGPHSFWGV